MEEGPDRAESQALEALPDSSAVGAAPGLKMLDLEERRQCLIDIETVKASIDPAKKCIFAFASIADADSDEAILRAAKTIRHRLFAAVDCGEALSRLRRFAAACSLLEQYTSFPHLCESCGLDEFLAVALIAHAEMHAQIKLHLKKVADGESQDRGPRSIVDESDLALEYLRITLESGPIRRREPDGAQSSSKRKQRKIDEATAFLQGRLKDGPKSSKMLADEGEALGITRRTLRRAATNLKVEGHGVWALPASQ
jgi:hypothetical protein